MAEDFLPGVYGQDYTFVRFNDKVYVVYKTPVGGKTVRMSWAIPGDKLEHYGATGGRIHNIGREQFRNLNFFGGADEITATGGDDPPFQSFLKDLREEFGNVSWLQDREVVEIFLMGHLEQMDPEAILNRVKQTGWYQKRTDRQREWELDMNDAQRKVELKSFRTRMMQEVDGLLGAGFTLDDIGVTAKELDQMVSRVASGKLGDPSEGFLVWSDKLRRLAEKVEGTNAWIEKDSAAAEQRGYLNRPEEMREQIRQDAFDWLGPKGSPDEGLLTKWAQRLVSGDASEEDWANFMRQQAKALYPWLGPNERWADRASSYKRISEDLLGKTIGYDHKLLAKIGGVDAAGKTTGGAIDYGDFEKLVRSTDEFWRGPVAEEEAFGVMGRLNQIFNGVSG